VEATPIKSLRIELKYGPNGERVIQRIRRVSKPGRRVYSKARDCAPSSMDWGFRFSAPVAEW
jgi:small subunit ribosomal protein S8